MQIGEGNYGVVYKGLWKGKDVAIKQLIIPKKEISVTNAVVMDFKCEVEVCCRVQHESLVQFLGYTTEPVLCIIQEYIPRGCAPRLTAPHTTPRRATAARRTLAKLRSCVGEREWACACACARLRVCVAVAARVFSYAYSATRAEAADSHSAMRCALRSLYDLFQKGWRAKADQHATMVPPCRARVSHCAGPRGWKG